MTRKTPHHFSTIRILATLALAALLATHAAAAPRRLALLIGVGQYADKRIPSLEGPAHDIDAMQAALREHWGFAPADIKVLLDRDATRAAILGAIEQLERTSTAGDQLFIYFSGHGTSASDRALNLPLPHSSGAFVPHELRMDGTPAEIASALVVGARDLRPRLARLDAGGRQVLVVSDSCYSGQAVRMLGALPGVRLRPRHLPIEALDGLNTMAALDSPATRAAPATRSGAATRTARPEPEPYPYQRIYYIAAASDSEAAVDIGSHALTKLPTIDNRPHGALTDALLRALTGKLPNLDNNRDGAIELGELYAGVQRFMAARAYPHTPQALPSAREDGTRLARAKVFDAAPRAGGGSTATPEPSTSASTASAAGANGARPLRVRLQDLAEAPAELRDLGAVHWLTAIGANATDAPAAGDIDFTLEARALPWRLRSTAGDLVLEAPRDAAAHVRRRLAASAWLRRLQTAAEQPARARMALEMQPMPASRGGTFVEGETFTLALRAERSAVVLVLVVDAEGQVSLLYPLRGEVGQRHAADAVVQTPSPASPLRVAPPFGTDELLAVAFEQPPEWWSLLPVSGTLPPGHALLAGLERALRPGAEGGAGGAVGLAVTPLRSVARPR
ncbi:MAG: caspase family protein [Betaproteobacteria bacterium]|nr:caspase family protein [Betaproteobacteria bacterium]MCC6246287.1 caspase family protein [Rubrivivax sp.]